MSLASLQSSFQAAILTDEKVVPDEILPSQRLTAADRFGVYWNAYRARLAEFLRNDFPALHAILGDDAFDALAGGYLDANRSHNPNARWFGDALPDFLSRTSPWCESPALADLAAFERALSDAFDAEDSSVLDAAALAGFAAEDQPRICFSFTPSLSVLTLAQGTIDAYSAALEGADAPAPDNAKAETVAIWRDAAQDSVYRCLEDDEALALRAAMSDATVDEICGLLSLRDNANGDAIEVAELAAVFLGRWFADGLVSGLYCR
ncbi:MAG: putative DNA-binding domain-containing protein [Methylovirgula sp.]